MKGERDESGRRGRLRKPSTSTQFIDACDVPDHHVRHHDWKTQYTLQGKCQVPGIHQPRESLRRLGLLTISLPRSLSRLSIRSFAPICSIKRCCKVDFERTRRILSNVYTLKQDIMTIIHKYQPLDRRVFGTLKANMKRHVYQFMSDNPGQKIGRRRAVQYLIECWEHLTQDAINSAWSVYIS